MYANDDLTISHFCKTMASDSTIDWDDIPCIL